MHSLEFNQGEHKTMLSLKSAINFTIPKIGFQSTEGLAITSSDLKPSPDAYPGRGKDKSDEEARSPALSIVVGNPSNSSSSSSSSNMPDPMLDLDRLPLPLPPISFEGRCIVRVERNRHHSPLARAFLPYYLFDDAGRQYLVITGNRQLVEAAQSQLQLSILSPSLPARALPPNIFSVATTDGVPAGRIHLFGNKLTLLPVQEDKEKEKEKEKERVSKGSGRVSRFGSKRVPVPVVLQFVEIKGVAQPQSQP
jgi:hypothetical protein